MNCKPPQAGEEPPCVLSLACETKLKRDSSPRQNPSGFGMTAQAEAARGVGVRNDSACDVARRHRAENRRLGPFDCASLG